MPNRRIGNVALNGDEVRDLARGIAQRPSVILRPRVRAVLTVERDFHLRRIAAKQTVTQRAQGRAVGQCSVQHRARAPDDLFALVAEGAREGIIDIDDRAGLVGLTLELTDHDHVSRVIEGTTQ
jgi:hypothetical protein